MKKLTHVVIPDHHKDNARAMLEEAINEAPDMVIALCFWKDRGQFKNQLSISFQRRAQWLSAMLFLDPVPARMREYAFPSDATLQGDGRNLSAVLFNLWGKDEQASEAPYAAQRAAILGFIQSLPEQDISGLSFLEEPRGAVMVKLTETFGGQTRDYDASLLSDGTLRVLSIAAAMLSAPEDSLVVIEEIDKGVHPSRVRRLLQNIREIAERRRLRVLLSTHNPALLDALPDSALPDVVFCYRELVTSGALERFVKQSAVEDRKAKAKAWLDGLRQGADRSDLIRARGEK